MKKFGAILLFLCVVGIVGGSRLLRLYNPNAIQTEKKVDLYLPEAVDIDQLTTILSDSLNAVEDEDELKWAANILGWNTFKPGHYNIDRGFSYNTFLSKLAKGNQDPIALTIVPGQRKEEILSFLSSRMRFDSTAIHHALSDSSFLAKNVLNKKTLVGQLFPATYNVYWTSSPKKVLSLIFTEFDDQMDQSYKKRANELGLSISKVLALASIIEGEAAHDDEKPKISGLYWNRLKRDMFLQADPTVNYAIGQQQRLYYKDYKVDHPYNTYTNKGLPPGPINNPSLSSIKAALYPKDHDFIFMVAQPNGYHAFTKTYAEHQQESREWRQYLKKMQAEPADSSS